MRLSIFFFIFKFFDVLFVKRLKDVLEDYINEVMVFVKEVVGRENFNLEKFVKVR